MRKSLPIFLAWLVLAGCSTSKVGGAANLAVVQGEVLPQPTRADLISMDRPYFVGSFDKLTIDVFGIKELSEKEVQVDASGRMSFPLIGTLEAAGKTPREIAAEMESRLRGQYIRDPQVTINLKETVSQVVTIEGAVKEPGLYPVVGKMTLMRAIATAKGTTEFSSLDDVVVFRTVAGKDYAGLYNLSAIRKGNYADPEVFANDVVMVGESRGRRLFRDFLQIAPLLTAPIILLLQ